MRPIVEKLDSSAHHLIIAPAGDLSLIPFGALHDGKRYLVEQYDLRYVTTGRDLLPPPATPPVTTTPVAIVANPAGANLLDAELEADFLASFFPHTRMLLDDQATETNVRTIERPLVLHMATHGFFGDALNERDNPLFRSGLYLADIDQVEVDRERDDGQLTAYEVSGMDLRGTQLVVLSACETGMGGVDMNEGVFGLRRAFAMAGARTTVMSLWEVSGVTTQKTMEAYYRNLAEGMGRGEAMQAVQLEMLRSEEHAHPKDWAAFIVSGDDTPMVFPAGEEPRVEEPEQPGPPPVRRRTGCAMAAPSSDGDPSVPAFLLGLLGLGALRRRRRRG
jgi:MYXO-CTERM domain-containing protein